MVRPPVATFVNHHLDEARRHLNLAIDFVCELDPKEAEQVVYRLFNITDQVKEVQRTLRGEKP